MAGLAVEVGLVWASFGLAVANGASPGTIAFDLALAQAVAGTIFAVAMFVLASFVPIGMLVSTAGALFLVSGFEGLGLGRHDAWSAGYAVMAALVLIGMATALIANGCQGQLDVLVESQPQQTAAT